jgi:uncharacterized repeat protein (TIGR03803 family)
MRSSSFVFAIAALVVAGSVTVASAMPGQRVPLAARPARPVAVRDSGAYTVLYAFTGQPDGAVPQGGVAMDNAGNIFGTTASGGANLDGSIYELSPSGSTYTERVIFSYTGPDGDQPQSTPLDVGGDIVATAPYGGFDSDGTVIRLTPAGNGYKKAVVHQFMGKDGSGPVGGIVHKGNLYYLPLVLSGANGAGAIDSLTPVTLKSTVQYSFMGGSGGGLPNTRLEPDGKGGYYGTTGVTGGANSTVYDFTPGGPVVNMYQFFGAANGTSILGVTRGKGAILYGTTNLGGKYGFGVLFKLTPSGSGYTEHVLHDFGASQDDGTYPLGTVLVVGNTIYGTTSYGGANTAGTIFKIGAAGKGYSVIYNFMNASGASPTGDLLWSKGAIYGVGYAGGPGLQGVVYRYVP